MGKKKKKCYKLILGTDIKNAYAIERLVKYKGVMASNDVRIPYFLIDNDAEKIRFQDMIQADGSIKFGKIRAFKFKLPTNVVMDLDEFKAITKKKKKKKNIKVKPCKNTTEYMHVTMDINLFMLLWNRYDTRPLTGLVPTSNPCCIFDYLGQSIAVACDKDGEAFARVIFMQ